MTTQARRQRKSVRDRPGYVQEAGRRYAAGKSIRQIAEELSGSYGWAHSLVVEAIARGLKDAAGDPVTIASRGGNQRGKKQTPAT